MLSGGGRRQTCMDESLRGRQQLLGECPQSSEASVRTYLSVLKDNKSDFFQDLCAVITAWKLALFKQSAPLEICTWVLRIKAGRWLGFLEDFTQSVLITSPVQKLDMCYDCVVVTCKTSYEHFSWEICGDCAEELAQMSLKKLGKKIK